MPTPLLLTAGTPGVSAYERLFGIWDAIWERWLVAGGDHFPPHHPVWASGTVQAISEPSAGSILVDCGNDLPWSVAAYPSGTQNRWVGFTPPPDQPGIPTAFDLVIETDPRKPWQTVRGPINAQSPNVTTGFPAGPGVHCTVTIGAYTTGGNPSGVGVQPAVSAKLIPSLASLVGKKWFIIKRGGYWSSDRMPERPNDHEAWAGICTGGQDHVPPAPEASDDPAEGPLYSYAQDDDPRVHWAVDRWAGKELMVWSDSGALRRVTILHSDSRRLYWAADSSWTATGRYSIVRPGAKCVPGRRKWRPGMWYSGPGDAFYTRMPDYDSIRTGGVLAADKVYWYENKSSSDIVCELVAHPANGSALDIDLQINPGEYEAPCDSGKTDDFPGPHIYKSFRAVQKLLIDGMETEIGALCRHFVKTPPTGSKAMKMFTPAEFLADSGSPNGTSTIYAGGTGGDTPLFNVNSDATAAGSIYFTVYNADGTVATDGVAPVTAGVARPTGVSTPIDTSGGTDAGKTVKWATSFRRYWQRRVRHLYGRTCFQPDILTDDIGSKTIADPPHPTEVLDDDGVPTGDWSSEGTGQWIHRPKSTHYAEYDEYGAIGDYGPAFITGDLVRVVGDNYADPTILDRVPADAASDSSGRMLLPYYDRFFRGTYAGSLESQYHAGRTGIATSGGKNRLTDSTKNWWTDGVNGGVLVTHGYTAASGTTTQISMNMDVNDATDKESRWFGVDRFVGMPSGKPFVDFVLEIDREEDIDDPDNPGETISQTVTHKFVVTDFTANTNSITLHFEAEEGFEVKKDMAFRICEPKYQLSKFQDRLATLVDPDGAEHAVRITHNDADTFWFIPISGPALTVTEGWTFKIDYVKPGTVLKRTATGWQVPTGNDGPRLGAPTASQFRTQPSNNLATYVRGYGLHRRGDAILDQTTLTQIYRGINLLVKTPAEVSWTSRATPATPEQNVNFISGGSWLPDGGGCFATAEDVTAASVIPGSEYGRPEFDYGTGLFWYNVPYTDSIWQNQWSFQRGKWQAAYPQDHEDLDHPELDWLDKHRGEDLARAPSRSFGLYGQLATYPGLNGPSAYYDVGIWLPGVGGSTGVYAYPKVTGVGQRFTSTVEIFVYTTIDAEDHEQGHVVTGPNYDRFGDASFTDAEYKFDAGGSGATYRNWTSLGSVTTDSTGTAIGPKFGDTEINDPPDTFPPPQGAASAIPTVDRVRSYTWDKTFFAGMYAKDQAAVVKWDFVYQSGTW